MILLGVKRLEKFFGQNILFQNVAFEVADNDKIGLVGVNGAGKTSLFKIITGQMANDGGEVYSHKLLKTAYMEQQITEMTDENSVYEEALSVFKHLTDMETEIENARLDIENKNGDIESLVKLQHRLNTQYEEQGGFLYKSRTRAVLLGLGFSENEMNLPLNALSGGQKTRVTLGKVLLGNANLLLLDEPTNHLDIAAVEWLENFLKSYKGAFLVISHDRYFLDKVTNRTFELENQRLTQYQGNYTMYLNKKAEDKLSTERRYENTIKEIDRINGIIEQQKRWNREKNIVTAQSKQKVVDKLEKTLVKPSQATENIRFVFADGKRSGNDVLIAEGLKKSFSGIPLFQNIDLHIKRGERVFLLGPNGCGKTTLFKIILGLLESDEGQYRLGANTETGYYDQIQSGLNPANTVLEEVSSAYPSMDQTSIRNALAAFLFKGDDVFKVISSLSGGEQARVSLLKLMLSKANFLLLDEPTNHLDITSREALEKAMGGYGGTLFIISHDRYFINKLADKILSFQPDGKGIKEYNGNYDDYLINMEVVVEEKPKAAPKYNEYKVRKENEAAKRRLLSQIARTEKSIHENEEAVKQLAAEAEKPENASDYEKVLEIMKEIEKHKTDNEQLYRLWEQLNIELEESDV